ncbi:MAG: hypothetical protein WDM96_18665 [Lacunisphaera sp.]
MSSSFTTRRDIRAEVARVGRNLHVGDLVDDLVADGGDQLLDPRFARALPALRQYDLVTFAPLFQ